MRDAIDKYWEGYYPYLGGGIYCAAAYFLTFYTDFRVSNEYFDAHEIWGVLVGLGAGSVGILFSVFVFTMAPAAGFVEKMTKTKIFPIFIRYVKESLAVNILAVAVAVPLTGFTSSGQMTAAYPILGIIASALAVCSCLALWRVGRIFLFWASKN